MLARGAQVLAAIGGAYLIALWFVLVVWTYRDIESRSKSVLTQVFSTLLVVLFFVPGVLLYLILRPKETLDQAFQRSLEEEYLLQDLEELPRCPTCHRAVRDDYVLCPHCHAQLRDACPSCSRLVDLRWAVCPYCAAPQSGQPETAVRVEAPAARWVAPSARRRRIGEGSREEGTPPEPAVLPVARTPLPAQVPSEMGDQETAVRPAVVRPLERFRGRASQTGDDAVRPVATGPLTAGPVAGNGNGVEAAAEPDGRPAQQASWWRGGENGLGSALLRSLGSYQALDGQRGASDAAVSTEASPEQPERPQADAEAAGRGEGSRG